jgi:hypothetical protein
VIFLRLKLKRELNALLPVRVGLRALAFEYSMRDFFEPQNVVEACWFRCFFTQFHEAFECKNPAMGTEGRSALGQGSYATGVKS